ncbi:unnamed protein product [Didymodactylos carnosus]|uniref:MATH domain-containing protein n=1 Tax=Didymodactylos carnosus TaxID=1234261 RepID=A0A8S2ENI7_9BILA|nr:unnamed protein product [Didymodactylos carnosus]CAF4004737.1 unnamed protein product [Didymodactylos carnosus]
MRKASYANLKQQASRRLEYSVKQQLKSMHDQTEKTIDVRYLEQDATSSSLLLQKRRPSPVQTENEERNGFISLSREDLLNKNEKLEKQVADLICLSENLKIQLQDLTDQCPVSTNGQLFWIIRDIEDKINDAQTQKQTFATSPVFFTSPNGYKMCMRLYLNGDGLTRGNHVSIFLASVPSVIDSYLNWPFRAIVTICLFDQTDRTQHIKKSFNCIIQQSSGSGGISKFIQTNVIHQYNNPYVYQDRMELHVRIQKPTPDLLLHIEQAVSFDDTPVMQDQEQRHQYREDLLDINNLIQFS